MVWIGQQALSLGGVALLFLAITQIYKNSYTYYKLHCPFHGVHAVSTRCHRIHDLKTFDLQLQIINIRLV